MNLLKILIFIKKPVFVINLAVQLYLSLYIMYCFIIAPSKPLGDIWWLIAFIAPLYLIFSGLYFLLFYLFTDQSEKAVIYILLQPFASFLICFLQFIIISL